MRLDKQGKSRSARPNDWTDVLAPEVIRQFEGKHIAIVYKRVIASGSTFDAVLEECLQLFPEETPYLAYIPTPEEIEEEDYTVSGSYVRGQSDTSVRQTPGDVAGTHSNLPNDDSQAALPELPSITDPHVDMFTPAKAPVGAGVTVTGVGLTGATQVLFGGTPAPSFTLLSDTSVFAVVPAGATGGPITVLTAGGVLTSRKPFVVVLPPALTSFLPEHGGIGTKVKLFGNSLSEASKVVFEGGVPAQILSISSGGIEVEVPRGAMSGKIAVTTPAGMSSTEKDFIIVAAPSVDSINPLSGAVGTRIYVNGSELTAIASVSIGGVPAEKFTVISPSQMSVNVPDTAISGNISVVNSAGSATSAARFTVLQQPVIKSLTPTTGGIGSKLMITGSYLSGVSSVSFNDVNAPKFTVISATFVSAEVPPGAVSGPVSVLTSAGAAKSQSDFVVVPAPIISSVGLEPDTLGTKVTVSGDNLLGAARIQVGETIVENFVVESASLITFNLEQLSENSVVKVTTAGGTAEAVTNHSAVPLPSIISFSPTSGPVGTVITVIGTNLDRASAAYVNRVKANVSAVASGRATVFVPADAVSGRISIVTPFGLCESQAEFEIITASAIKDISPSTGPAGSLVTILGWGFKSTSIVMFGGIPSPSVTISSNNTVVAQVPYGATTGDVLVDGPTGGATGPEPFTVTLSITSVQPGTGSVGSSAAISGIGFRGAKEVLFSGVKAQFEVLSDTTILAKVPAPATDGPVQVVTESGSTNSSSQYRITAF
jgi:hypothetical protein